VLGHLLIDSSIVIDVALTIEVAASRRLELQFPAESRVMIATTRLVARARPRHAPLPTASALAHSAIRYRLTADGIIFTESATTGRQFRVVAKNGRIATSNLEPYAEVF
jgi:hypothetical protein